MGTGIVGGFLFGGLMAWALFGLVPGIILMALGAAASCFIECRNRQAAKQAESWRRNYPSYKY